MSHPRSDSEDNPVFVEPMELDHRSEKPADGESSYEDAIHYIDEFPETTTVPQVVVPTLEELGYHRSEYVKARTLSVQPQVVKVLEELEAEDGKLSYRVRLGDGHVKEVSFTELTAVYKNGSRALNQYLNPDDGSEDEGDPNGSQDEAQLPDGDEDESDIVEINPTRAARKRGLLSLQRKRKQQKQVEGLSEDELSAAPARTSGRTTRSKGLRQVTMLSYREQDRFPRLDSEDDLVVSDTRPRRTTRRAVNARSTRNRCSAVSDIYTENESDHNQRRSSRTKRQKKSYRELAEDEDLVQSDLIVKKPKPFRPVHSKEVFPILESDDEFVTVHNPVCDSCKVEGDSAERGHLVYCHGCSMSYHKVCMGHRSAREHLVTKVSSANFVLQCRRCIGIMRKKDKLQAAFDRCTECRAQGHACKPFSSPRKKEIPVAPDGTRELTPDTNVPADDLYNPRNVLFRCTGCFRAWHYDHLPALDSRPSNDVWNKRVKEYTAEWKCKLCFETPGKIQQLIAWRPLDEASREADVDIEDFTEDEREYLIKFEGESYFKARWVPGAWISAQCPVMRRTFIKKAPPAKMRTEDAINEEWLRIDIVLDVEYTSYVPMGEDVEVDLARLKEVSRAYVKFRGLGYEDVVWEIPPDEEDTERYTLWRRAYEDFIHGQYVHTPKNVLKKIEKARGTDFKRLEMKGQPRYISGGELMEYQKEGMNWLYYKWWKGQNAILADEMGLGKTIQIISYLSILFEEQKVWPFLVVVPHSTVPNWKREIQRWAPGLRVVAYFGSEASRRLCRKYEMFHPGTNDLKCHVVITSYTCPTSDMNILRKISWECLVVDEGQRLKSDETQLYTSLEKYRVRHKVLLSGTPLQNNPRELFNLLQFLDPQNINAAELEVEFGQLTNENVPVLHNLIRPFFLRRTKGQVLTHLPPMAEVIIPVSMTPLQRKLYKSILAKDPDLIKNILFRGKAKVSERAKLNNLLMQLRKCVCHPFLYNQDIEEKVEDPVLLHNNLVEAGSKLKLLSLLLPKLRERGHRVLMFSQFLGMLDIVEDFLTGMGFLYQRLDGGTSSLERQKSIDAFNAPNSPLFAFLLSTRAGGVGINLATADTVIILDPDFNPHQDIQALSRAHRIGQKNKVLVFHLVTRDTAEERIMQIGKKKLSMDHLIIERMAANPEEEEVDVESILKFGASKLFDDDAEERDIQYDDESIDKLLDRSTIENTETTGAGSAAENAFSFARVWANDKGTLEDAQLEEGKEDTPRPQSLWEKILQERETLAAREAEEQQKEFGRGRRRKQVNYTEEGLLRDVGVDDDTDFRATSSASDAESDLPENDVDMSDLPPVPFQPPTLPFKPAPPPPVPTPSYPQLLLPAPAPNLSFHAHKSGSCSACRTAHAKGSCPLRAPPEKCPFCGIAHFGKASVCPHLGSETQMNMMLDALRNSTEDKALVEEAKRYLRGRKGNLRASKKQERMLVENRGSMATVKLPAGPVGRVPEAPGVGVNGGPSGLKHTAQHNHNPHVANPGNQEPGYHGFRTQQGQVVVPHQYVYVPPHQPLQYQVPQNLQHLQNQQHWQVLQQRILQLQRQQQAQGLGMGQQRNGVMGGMLGRAVMQQQHRNAQQQQGPQRTGTGPVMNGWWVNGGVNGVNGGNRQ